jgi:hypothetical protein
LKHTLNILKTTMKLLNMGFSPLNPWIFPVCSENPMASRGASAAVVVYDQTNAVTFERAQEWVRQAGSGRQTWLENP